jgi:hypothetical protein
MANPLLPQAFWFRLSVPCLRLEGIPRANSKGRVLSLPESHRLPDMAQLDGAPGWADVRVAWNAAGLGVSVQAESGDPPNFSDRPEGAYGFQVWIDTRDTRNVSRATRFCHRFSVRLLPGGSARSELGIEVVQRPIARAVADAPIARPDRFIVRAERLRRGWAAELFLPAETLNGFDPETNRRLGFAYQISEPERQDQFLGAGREFPLGENPGLWSTLELRD